MAHYNFNLEAGRVWAQEKISVWGWLWKLVNMLDLQVSDLTKSLEYVVEGELAFIFIAEGGQERRQKKIWRTD